MMATATATIRRDIETSIGHTDVIVRVFDELASTNDYEKACASQESDALRGLAPTLCLARAQTGGRGRMGRSFHSPADSGLYMTVAYTTTAPLCDAVRITAGASVATATAIHALTGKQPCIKWVNDLYLNDGKLCGILTEAVTLPPSAEGLSRTRMIVGIGVNLTTRAFPPDLRAPAASLFTSDEEAAAGGLPLRIGTLAGEITRRLLALLENTAPDFPDGVDGAACLAYYRAHSLLTGRRVLCTRGDEQFCAVAEDVDDTYRLVLRMEDGSRRLLDSGEASVRTD